MTEPEDAPRAELEDRPPLLGTWRNIYAVVLGTLAIVILVLTAITAVYA